jgi:bifunctional DNA-binding transcriptional regulator/antitoxin component of YhaV-PrlF toxin-antitoxin module
MIAKMSSKGKLTLPPAARKALGESIVSIDVVGEIVVLKAIKSENTLNARKQLAELRCVSHISDATTPVDTEWDTLHAIPDMSGCLSKYAKNPAEPLGINEIRKKVWSEVAHDKAN